MFIAKQLRPFLRLEGKVILFILVHLLFLNGEDNFAIKEQTRVLGQLKDVFFAYVITRTKVEKKINFHDTVFMRKFFVHVFTSGMFFNKRIMNDELFSFYAMTRRGQIYQNT